MALPGTIPCDLLLLLKGDNNRLDGSDEARRRKRLEKRSIQSSLSNYKRNRIKENKMEKQNVTVGVFGSHESAESAIKELRNSGFDMKKLSIIGKDYHTEEHAVGFYNTGDRVKAWGKLGAFWGGLFGLLFGSAFLIIPGIGHVMVFGPLVSWIVSALESALVVGGFSALGAALFSIGIPKDSIVKYETAVKANKFLVIAHGTAEEAEKARSVLSASSEKDPEIYHA